MSIWKVFKDCFLRITKHLFCKDSGKWKQWSSRVKYTTLLLNTPTEACISIPKAYFSPNLCSLIVIFIFVCLISCTRFYTQKWEALFILLKRTRIAPWENNVLVTSACLVVVQEKLLTLHCQQPLSCFNGISLSVAREKQFLPA